MSKIHPISQTNLPSSNTPKTVLPIVGTATAAIGSYIIGERIDIKNSEAERIRYTKAQNNHHTREMEAQIKYSQADSEYQKAVRKELDLLDNYDYIKNRRYTEKTVKKYYKMMALFPDRVTSWSDGKVREIDNCLMFYGKDKEFAEFLINWYGKETEVAGGIFKTINVTDDILEAVEANRPQGRKSYHGKKTSPNEKWQLLFVKDFENLIHSKKSKFSIKEGTKALMSAFSEYFNTTVVFYTENPEELDEIALESHRTRWFNVDDPSWDKEEFKRYVNHPKERQKAADECIKQAEIVKEKKKIAEELEKDYEKIKKETVEYKKVKNRKWTITAIGAALIPLTLLIKKLMNSKKEKKK